MPAQVCTKWDFSCYSGCVPPNVSTCTHVSCLGGNVKQLFKQQRDAIIYHRELLWRLQRRLMRAPPINTLCWFRFQWCVKVFICKVQRDRILFARSAFSGKVKSASTFVNTFRRQFMDSLSWSFAFTTLFLSFGAHFSQSVDIHWNISLCYSQSVRGDSRFSLILICVYPPTFLLTIYFFLYK